MPGSNGHPPLTLFPPEPLRLPALRMRQGRDRVLYAFAVDGKRVEEFAAVSRLGRDDARRIVGYQRPEVLSHIAEIRAYLESDNPMLPNAVVIAFDPTVRFEPLPGDEPPADAPSVPGVLVIPTRDDARKPGWIVDGQQRLAAVREAAVDSFPVWVVGFIAGSDAEQREQFILVNNTKPLPKGLVYELLPATEARLPTALGKRRIPIALLDRLNLDADSPLRGRVKTPTMPDGLIKDNSLIKMIENSLSDGVLYRLRRREEGAADVEGMLGVLKAFWAAVAAAFPEAWGKKPKESRLLHGAGVVALGFLMDAIADRGGGRGCRRRPSSGPTWRRSNRSAGGRRGTGSSAPGRCGSGTRCRTPRRTSRCWRTTCWYSTSSGCGTPPGEPASLLVHREHVQVRLALKGADQT